MKDVARKDTALVVDIPTTGLAKYITDLAKQHNVAYVKTLADEWADTITGLSDDSIESDDIEDLLLALKRAEILNIDDMLSLLVNYLREKHGECDAGRN
ncbi:DUF4187 domain-containing protein [Methylobacter tundripaludum]|uniref:DUF4187 domain-containing protein n=1 Tax=Methylobacter tundripaludum TaxID=173365 RepID=UPI00068E57B0|nr:DUF4187 domain-containing protein [Methylobacter tundripaludum]